MSPSNDDPFANVFMDLAIDPAGTKLGKWLIFGWRGDSTKRDVECSPFVIDRFGKIDFGSDWDYDEDRYGRTDLFDKRIAVGEFAQFDLGSEGKTGYQVFRLHHLSVPIAT